MKKSVIPISGTVTSTLLLWSVASFIIKDNAKFQLKLNENKKC